MFIKVANIEAHLDFNSTFKPHSLVGIDRTSPDSAVLWLGRLRAVISFVSKEA